MELEDKELQKWLDEEQELARWIHIDHSNVLSHLNTMGKILKIGRWVLHALS